MQTLIKQNNEALEQCLNVMGNSLLAAQIKLTIEENNKALNQGYNQIGDFKIYDKPVEMEVSDYRRLWSNRIIIGEYKNKFIEECKITGYTINWDYVRPIQPKPLNYARQINQVNQ